MCGGECPSWVDTCRSAGRWLGRFSWQNRAGSRATLVNWLAVIAITNDIYTKVNQRLLTVAGALPAERILGVETGGCPHTAIREDAAITLEAIETMLERFPDADIVFVESGGDNLAATFSPQLSDLTIYVIDVAGGETRKGRPRHHPFGSAGDHQDRPRALRRRLA